MSTISSARPASTAGRRVRGADRGALARGALALADVDGPTRALLMLTHLVAAAIVVPTLARRLPRTTAGGRTDG